VLYCREVKEATDGSRFPRAELHSSTPPPPPPSPTNTHPQPASTSTSKAASTQSRRLRLLRHPTGVHLPPPPREENTVKPTLATPLQRRPSKRRAISTRVGSGFSVPSQYSYIHTLRYPTLLPSYSLTYLACSSALSHQLGFLPLSLSHCCSAHSVPLSHCPIQNSPYYHIYIPNPQSPARSFLEISREILCWTCSRVVVSTH
jgi:hypothetical protein